MNIIKTYIWVQNRLIINEKENMDCEKGRTKEKEKRMKIVYDKVVTTK